VQRITRGDETAFSELLARYRSTVYATAYAVLLDPEQVDAVVADAFGQCLRLADTPHSSPHRSTPRRLTASVARRGA